MQVSFALFLFITVHFVVLFVSYIFVVLYLKDGVVGIRDISAHKAADALETNEHERPECYCFYVAPGNHNAGAKDVHEEERKSDRRGNGGRGNCLATHDLLLCSLMNLIWRWL